MEINFKKLTFLGSAILHVLIFYFTGISSWGGGANPWGFERDDQFSMPNHWDGMLEVVGVTGVLHLGQIQSGLRSAIRIAQVCFDKKFDIIFFTVDDTVKKTVSLSP